MSLQNGGKKENNAILHIMVPGIWNIIVHQQDFLEKQDLGLLDKKIHGKSVTLDLKKYSSRKLWYKTVEEGMKCVFP